MNHYAYLLEFPNGMKYFGARSTHLDPVLDASYLGSGKSLPSDRYIDKPSKTIVATFTSREELMSYERNFIVANRCTIDDSWYNQRKATFDRHGQETPWNVNKAFDKTKFANTYSERYKNNRSVAMLKAHAETAEKNRGVKNLLKGHKGTSNTAFKPWYYITPSGEYVEVHTTTVRDMAESLGWTERQIINRLGKVNKHLSAKTLPMKGWTFGQLPRPATVIE